ncbi:DUF4158 domain-containing protein [Streptomyces sp. NPDC056308]|uniref:DUF4158 domain-containing protein n=1 Tax=Streptomyces sp. NPDC056308 TaxID=3345780 RepID=UPI0035D702ED
MACRVCPAACARFKRLITAHELHLFVAPTRDEAAWAAERMDSDGHQLALLLALMPYQRMGRPKPDEYPEVVVDFVRRTVELPQGTLPSYATGRTAERQRTEVRQRVGTKYQQARARQIAEAAIRKEAAAKNRPADLIKIGLEKVVAAGLELPAFSTFDTMTSTIRTEVNASILPWHPRPDERCPAGGAARMRVRDDLATMLCKRVARKIKKAKEELEEIRLAEREIVEALIGNCRTVFENIDADGPAQAALERAAGMTAGLNVVGLDQAA